MSYTHSKYLSDKMSLTNYLLVYGLFFNVVASIVQAFFTPRYKLQYLTIIQIYQLLSKPHFKFDLDIIIIVKDLLSKFLFHVKKCVVVDECMIRDHRRLTCSGFFMKNCPTSKETPLYFVEFCRFINLQCTETFSFLLLPVYAHLTPEKIL